MSQLLTGFGRYVPVPLRNLGISSTYRGNTLGGLLEADCRGEIGNTRGPQLIS